MKRILALALLLGLILSSLTVDFAAAEVEGAFQAGIGAASLVGSPLVGVSYQVVTLHAAGLLLSSKWAMGLVDISYGFPHEYKHTQEGSVTEAKVSATYLDGMIGVHKSLSGGGFIYIGGGLTLAWGDLESTSEDSTTDIDFNSALGLVYGAGLALPITDPVMGFISVRQRSITTEAEIRGAPPRATDLSVGGFDMAVGVLWRFGR